MTLVRTKQAHPSMQRMNCSPVTTCLVELHTDRSRDQSGAHGCSIKPWHVIHTKSRQEKALARAFDAAGIHCELPVVKRIRFYGHRKREVTVPLFTNYIFVQGSLDVTYFAMKTQRVASVISVHDQEGFVRDLEQIRHALAGGADMQPYRYLTVGRRVRVTAGPFKDLEGLIEEKPKPDRLILQMDALCRAASLEIDAGLLEPVD